MDNQRLTLEKTIKFFLLYVPLFAAAFLTKEHFELPNHLENNIFSGFMVFMSVTCVSLVYFKNWETLIKQLVTAAAGGVIVFAILNSFF
jgi:hypothetical protein